MTIRKYEELEIPDMISGNTQLRIKAGFKDETISIKAIRFAAGHGPGETPYQEIEIVVTDELACSLGKELVRLGSKPSKNDKIKNAAFISSSEA